ncbi:MAG: KpsF/GutQ family sugar-phosphate isomerase [Gammaproteobacteria bacterium]
MTLENKEKRLLSLGYAVIDTEATALRDLAKRMDNGFAQACQHMLDCKGRIVVLGMGKSGHIGSKIAATLASTGTPAFFVHPGEASHGDMGMIVAQDAVLAISNSGETQEISVLLPLIKRLSVPLIALTGNPGSTLALAADTHLDVSVEKEACPMGLAPTSSTTAALAMGDALAIALLEERGFSEDDFALSHPGGSLGKKLLLRVSDVIHTDQAMPMVREQTSLADALVEMSAKGLGMTTVVDDQKKILGIFTDGDLRRALDKGVDVHKVLMNEVMTSGGTRITEETLAAEALRLMQEKRINALVVVDQYQTLKGVLNMHDLLRAGVI